MSNAELERAEKAGSLDTKSFAKSFDDKSSDKSSKDKNSEGRNPKILRMTDIVFPDATNHYGTLFAGNMMALMVRAAFLTATRFSNQSVVLVGADQVDCFLPVKVGSIVDLKGQIVYTGNTSVTVKVDLFSEDPIQKTSEHAACGYFNLVAVDSLGKSTSVVQHVPSTDEEKNEWKRVAELKAFRLRA